MTLLIQNNTDLIKYLPISESDFDFDRISPFLKQAQLKYIIPAISKEEFDLLDESASKKEVHNILASATAHFAMHLGFVQLSTFLSNAGMLVPNPKDEANTLNWADRKDLQRYYLSTGLENIDQALELMQADTTTFSKWKDSNNYTLFDETFCRTKQDFNTFQNIKNSAQTFLRLRPYMREVWQQYFEQWLSTDVINAIKADPKLLQRAQQAEAAYTVMKAIQQDGFIENHSGVSAIIELLPWEKFIAQHPSDLRRKIEAKRNQGDQAIERLQELLLEGNHGYTEAEFEAPARFKKLNSGLSF